MSARRVTIPEACRHRDLAERYAMHVRALIEASLETAKAKEAYEKALGIEKRLLEYCDQEQIELAEELRSLRTETRL